MKVTQLCLSLYDPKDYTVHGLLQARILEWVAFRFSRGSSQPRSLALPVDSLPAEPQGKLLLTKDEDYLQKEGHWHRGSMRHSIFFTLNLQLAKMSLPHTQGIWGISHNCAFKDGCTRTHTSSGTKGDSRDGTCDLGSLAVVAEPTGQRFQ